MADTAENERASPIDVSVTSPDAVEPGLVEPADSVVPVEEAEAAPLITKIGLSFLLAQHASR